MWLNQSSICYEIKSRITGVTPLQNNFKKCQTCVVFSVLEMCNIFFNKPI